MVNGKPRGNIFAAFGTNKEELEARALADEKVKPFLEGKQGVKIITVPDKLVNNRSQVAQPAFRSRSRAWCSSIFM